MKKLLMLLMAAVFLVACSNDEKESKNDNPGVEEPEVVETAEDERTDEQKEQDLKASNESFKSDSVEYDFVAYFRNETPVDGKVKFTGEVVLVGKQGFGGEFTLEQDVPVDNGETTRGIIKVDNMNIGDPVEIVEGKILTVYGIYDGKNDIDIPVIKAVVIEEQ